MSLLDVDHDLSVCESHLNQTSSKGTDIESFLTQFLLIRICAQFEQEIGSILIKRACQCNDPELINFIESRFKAYRHLKLKDLRNILGDFGNYQKDNFNQKIKGKEPEVRYDNIVNNRDSAAHRGTLQITFDELKTSYYEAKKVLIAFNSAVNLAIPFGKKS